MRRRDHLVTAFAGAAAWPLAARAQQEPMRRIGVLLDWAIDDPEPRARVAAFRDGLKKLGWTDGRNIRIDTRWAADAASLKPARGGARRAAAGCDSLADDKHHRIGPAANANHSCHFRSRFR